MFKEYSIVLVTIVTISSFVALLNAEEVPNSGDNNKGTSNVNQMAPKLQKRAWNQLQGGGGWGKRAMENEANEEPSIDQIQRKLMKLYAEQLLANKLNDDDMEYFNTDYDNGNAIVDSKRAWSQLQGGWGKRDWQQLRGNGWGKREKWGKLSSAWGKK